MSKLETHVIILYMGLFTDAPIRPAMVTYHRPSSGATGLKKGFYGQRYNLYSIYS